MKAHLLQDWITIQTKDPIASCIQTAHDYLDVGQYEDLVFYLDVRRYTGSPVMKYQTSPSQQDSSFLDMIASIPLSAIGLRVDRAMFSTAAVPPAKFVRWYLQTQGDSTATFRIWVAAYKFY